MRKIELIFQKQTCTKKCTYRYGIYIMHRLLTDYADVVTKEDMP